MTAARPLPTVPVAASWREPNGIHPRGTVIVVPGRGEHAGVYERFGRRIAADGYRVEAVSAPTADEARTERQVRALLADPATGPEPRVLVGSDAGALFAAAFVARTPAGVAGLVLAGLPATPGRQYLSWDDELDARSDCPTHRGRLADDPAVLRGGFGVPVPGGWFARPEAIAVPVLGLHGAADPISPLDAVRPWYAALASGELVGIAGGKHDALNDQSHRTAAATVVLFLERLRAGGTPIAEVVR